jgi:hypothetical protein
LDSHAHGRVLFPAQRNFQWIIHGYDFAGQYNLRARMGELCQVMWQAHQNQTRVGVLFKELPAGRQRDFGAMVASHAVDSDCDHGAGTQKEKNIKQWPRAKNDKSPTLQNLQLRALHGRPGSGFCFGLQHLAAAVKTSGADVVAQVCFTRGGLYCNAWNNQSIVRAVHTALGRRLFILLDGHDPLLGKSVAPLLHAKCNTGVSKQRGNF